MLRLLPLFLIATAGCDAAARPAPETPASTSASLAGTVPSAPAARAGSPPVVLPGAGVFTGGGHKVADLAAGPGGRLHAVFLSDSDGDGRGDRVLYARSDGASWSPPEPLDETPTRSEGAQVAVDGDGRVHVFWLEGGSPADARKLTEVRHRALGGGRWSTVQTVYREPSEVGVQSPTLDAVTDGGGAVHLLHARTDRGFGHLVPEGDGWREAEGADRVGSYGRWSAGRAMDIVYVAADLLPGEMRANSDVWYRPAAGGGWGDPVRVHRGEGYSYEPQLFTDARGVRHVAWREGGRALESDHVLYATSADGRAWSEPRRIDAGIPVRQLQSLRLAAGGSGAPRLTFAATVLPSAAGPGGPRHFIIRLDGDGAAAASPLFPDLPPPAGGLETAAAEDGTIHAVWKAADGAYRHAVLRP